MSSDTAMKVDQKKGKEGKTSVFSGYHVRIRLVQSDKLRFKAVMGLSTVFEIDIPVKNTQRHNALVAVRWQVKINFQFLLTYFFCFLF